MKSFIKNTKNLNALFKALGWICTPTTFLLACLWYLYPDKNYEPITVALGSLSVIFFGVAQMFQDKKFEDLEIEEILDIVNNSQPEDWTINYSQGLEIALFKKYPALRIETKQTPESIQTYDFHEGWAHKFLDPHATSYYYHLYNGSTRLKEFILVSVDGGRAALPLPKSSTDLSVKPICYKIAMIFDRSHTCDDYMQRAGLYLENNK